jgi:hypothetical protein
MKENKTLDRLRVVTNINNLFTLTPEQNNELLNKLDLTCLLFLYRRIEKIHHAKQEELRPLVDAMNSMETFPRFSRKLITRKIKHATLMIDNKYLSKVNLLVASNLLKAYNDSRDKEPKS